MWLKKLWTGLTLKRVTQPYKDQPYHQPKRALCVELLNRLDVDAFQSYRSVHGLGAELTVVYPSVDLYTTKLLEAADLVRQEKAIAPHWASPIETVLSLDSFLASSDGYYLEIPEEVKKFKAAGLALCEALESSDYVTHGLPEHNLRMLTKLLVNLQSIIPVFIEVGTQR